MDEDSDSDSDSESNSGSDNNTQARTVDLSRLKHGVSKAVVLQCNMSRRSVVRIWKNGMLGGGVNAVINKKKKRCGRKRIELDTV
ncbi:hypothetical protein D1007_09579 [Hordeum vulgare]|nr:hypothetical protein D1007_09579 [Hordeum vulgare]